MMDYQRTTTTVSAPAGAPIDLNAGKPTWSEIAPLFGLTLLTVLVIAGGGGLVRWAWPTSEYEPVSGGTALLLLLGGLLMFAGGSFFWTLRGAVLRGINRYYDRLDDWHEATLTKYQESDGRITAQQVDERYLSDSSPRDMLLLFLLMWYQNRSYSIRDLTNGPLLLTVGNRSHVIGRMTQDAAENALSLFARAGAIVDRAPRAAGRLAISDPRKVLNKLLLEMNRDPRVLAQMQDEEER